MNRRSRVETKSGQGIKIRLTAAAVLLLISAVLMITAAKAPDFAEWYSGTVYPLIVTTAGRLWGIFPFPVSEVILYIMMAAFTVSLVVLAVRTVRSHSAEFLASWVSTVVFAAGILAFLYTLCCGINYQRRSFSEEAGIVTYVYSVEELEEICLWLTEEVNSIAGTVERDEDGVMKLSAPEGAGAVGAMQSLAEQFAELDGYYPTPKEIMVSEILSYQGLTGIYSPFTVEANYNGDMTAYNIPFTACHELSHLRGFMQEEEANFIGFLACTGSERADFRYSGYLSGWVYCMNTLYRSDYESWSVIRPLLDEKAEADLAANNVFWEKYEGTLSEMADKVNDTYLKVNGQTDGVQSYNRMVDLIVAYFYKNS